MTSAQFRQHLLACLGGDWPEASMCSVRSAGETIQADGYVIESIEYESEPGDWVPALVLVPDTATAASPAPAVAVWHQHAGQYEIGKSEPAGLAGDPMHHTGAALACEGYVVICPDALCFEQRQDPTGKLKGGNYERFEFLRYVVRGRCLAWKNILDMRRAIDVLCARPEVADTRIGCYGHSMGSTHAWLVAPWEERIRCVVGNCCLPTYAGIEENRLLHCFPNFIPGLLQHGDTPDIATLIAPRPLHLNFGELDGGSPIEHVGQAIETIAEAYKSGGHDDAFTHYIEKGSGHVLSPEMWERTRRFFAKHLR